VFVRDVLDEQHEQHVVLVLGGVHAAAQGVAAGPDGGIEFGFLDGHAWFLWRYSASQAPAPRAAVGREGAWGIFIVAGDYTTDKRRVGMMWAGWILPAGARQDWPREAVLFRREHKRCSHIHRNIRIACRAGTAAGSSSFSMTAMAALCSSMSWAGAGPGMNVPGG